MSYRVVVDINNRKFNNTIFRRTGIAYLYLRKKTRKVANMAERLAPVRTGALRASITYNISISKGVPMGIVEANVPYAKFVHEGTSPHIITPKTGKVLKFVTSRGVVHTPLVRHPGAKANEYLREALIRVMRP